MANKQYSYPEVDNSRTGTYLTFSAYNYGSENAKSRKKFFGTDASKLLTIKNDSLQNGDPQKNNENPGPFEQTINALNRIVKDNVDRVGESFTARQQAEDVINLYLPPKLEYQYSANWQKVQLGALGSGTSPAGAAGAGLATGVNSLFNAASGLLSNVPKLENLGLDSLVGATLGISFNDNTVQTFDKMNPRNFSFEYIMVARNIKERDSIENIVKTFKLGMHPTLTEGGDNKSLFLGYPLVWQIQPSGVNSTFKVRDRNGTVIENNPNDLLEFLPRTDLCALTDVKVDYTPENNIALLKGGFVQAVRLSLSFTELITLTRQDLEELEYSGG